MAEIKVTTELCVEDRKRIDDVFYALTQLVELAKGRPAMAAEVGKLVELPVHPPTEDPAPEAPEEPETTEAPAGEEKPKITLEDIRQKVVALSAADKKTEVRSIIKKYADKVSAIAEEAYVEVWDQLTALEG